MDSRIQKAMELDALKATAEAAKANTATLDTILARLDKIEEAASETLKLIAALAEAKTPTPTPTKGGR